MRLYEVTGTYKQRSTRINVSLRVQMIAHKKSQVAPAFRAWIGMYHGQKLELTFHGKSERWDVKPRVIRWVNNDD